MRYWTVLCSLSVVYAVLAGCASPKVETQDLSMVTLERSVHFMTPDGSDLVAPAGSYRLEKAEQWNLRMTPEEGGGALMVQAVAMTHDEAVDAPVALSIPEEGDEHHLVLLMADGRGIDAGGSYSGVRSRGGPRLISPMRVAEAHEIAIARRARRDPRRRVQRRLRVEPYSRVEFIAAGKCSSLYYRRITGTPVKGTRLTQAPMTGSTLWNWGLAGAYLGDTYGGDYNLLGFFAPVEMPISGHVVALAASSGGGESTWWGKTPYPHSCFALLDDGTVWTWGGNYLNSHGKLHINYVEFQFPDDPAGWSTPVQIPALSGMVAIAAGAQHGLALKDDGTVMAWGTTAFGALGDGRSTTGDEASPHVLSPPVVVEGLSGITAIAAGCHASVALNQYGQVQRWGLLPSYIVDSQDDETWASIAFGMGYMGGEVIGLFVVKLVKTIEQAIWPPQELHSATPEMLVGLDSTVKAIAAGWAHFLALKQDGTVWSWGFNGAGQLGDGTTTSTPWPVQVQNLTDVVAIDASHSYSLALKSDGSVWIWGGFPGVEAQELVYHTTTGLAPEDIGLVEFSTVPVKVKLLGPPSKAVKQIAAGADHVLVVGKNGTVWTWGENKYGQLGRGDDFLNYHLGVSVPTKVEFPSAVWGQSGRSSSGTQRTTR